MSDDLVKRLRDHIAVSFDDRGHVFEDDALCDDAADRIEELEAKLKSMAMDNIAADLSIEMSSDRIKELEANLAKLTKAADRVHDSYWNATDGIIVGMFDLGEALREASTTLAELTGGNDE